MSSDLRLLYLSRSDVEAVDVTTAEIIAALEAAFREHGQGFAEMPPKPGVHSRPDAFIHAMPAYIPALAALHKTPEPMECGASAPLSGFRWTGRQVRKVGA